MRPKTVGLIIFEQVAAADLTGPAEAFSRANISDSNGCESSGYNVLMLGITAQPCRTECGIVVKPHTDLGSAPPLDTVIIPGGSGIRDGKVTNKVAKWLNHRSSTTRRLATLGTGIYPVAATGMLDHRQVATHWRYASDVAQRFPSLRVNANCLFVKDGPFYTSAARWLVSQAERRFADREDACLRRPLFNSKVANAKLARAISFYRKGQL